MNENQSKITKSDPFNLRDTLFKYLNRWYWFVISVVVFTAIAFVYLQSVDIKYSVSSSILLRNQKSNSPLSGGGAEIFESLGFASMGDKRLDDEILMLKSRENLKSVILALEFNTEYYRYDKLRKLDMYPNNPVKLVINPVISDTLTKVLRVKMRQSNNGIRIDMQYGKKKKRLNLDQLPAQIESPIGTVTLEQIKPLHQNTSYLILHYPSQHIVEKYVKNIRVSEVNKKANAIRIATEAANTSKAKDFISSMIEFYNLDAVLDKNLFATNTAEFIDERLELIKVELFDAEREIEAYKLKYNFTNMMVEAELLLTTNVEYQRDIEKIENQLNIVNFVDEHLRKGDDNTTIPLNLGLESEGLIALIQNYNELVLLRMKLDRTAASPNNPALLQATRQLEELRSNILLSMSSLKESLTITKNGLAQKNDEYFRKIKSIPAYEREYYELLRQQSIKHNLYLFLMQKREENAMTLASAVPSAKVLDKASASILPVSPRKMVILAVAALLGLSFPIILLYFKDMISNTIADKKELLRLVKAPFLGSIMHVKDVDRVVVREGATTPIVELFRLIRTNLQFMFAGKKSPVILVTSSIGGEGKSFTAINMAMSFALTKQKVVLVGLDIRKPMLGEYMHIAKNKGVSMYLADAAIQLNDIMLPSGIHPDLHVIPAGPIPPNPGELLMSPRLDELFVELKKEFDYIIVDSAPIGKVSDTYLLNRIVDNTVYVTRQDYTPREVAELINDIYEHKKLNQIGIVLNNVSHSTSSGYGYGYGYSADEKTSRSIFRK